MKLKFGGEKLWWWKIRWQKMAVVKKFGGEKSSVVKIFGGEIHHTSFPYQANCVLSSNHNWIFDIHKNCSHLSNFIWIESCKKNLTLIYSNCAQCVLFMVKTSPILEQELRRVVVINITSLCTRHGTELIMTCLNISIHFLYLDTDFPGPLGWQDFCLYFDLTLYRWPVLVCRCI